MNKNRNRFTSFLLLVLSIFAAHATADKTVAPVFMPLDSAAKSELVVMPDHANWTYSLKESAKIKIRILRKPYPKEGIAISYKLGPEMLEGDEIKVVVPEKGLDLPVAPPKEPGFIRCIVSGESPPDTQIVTLGFSPEKLLPTQIEPKDFDGFWAEQKGALEDIPPDYQLTPAPSLSTDKVDVFYLSFQNFGNFRGHGRFYGVLAVPRSAGTFPAVLHLPGAGVRGYTGVIGMAEKGVITLQIGINGIPVDLPAEVYDQLDRGALNGYNRYNLDDRYTYYYRRVYMGALRASEYLTTHPKWDGKNLVVMGGSQGGQLTIVTAALNPKVTLLAASYPAYSDVSGYLYGRAGGWPGLFRLKPDGTRTDTPIEAKLLTTGYYDTVNFARRVKVPGIYFFGYNDPITPPTSTYTAYNQVAAPKELIISVQQDHHISAQQQARVDDWVLNKIIPAKK